MATRISLRQARRFLLRKHGLLGARRFRGSEGLLSYVGQVGCVQYDPVDVCGKSHELAFLARVEDFSRGMLEELLYGCRELIDFFDKNMSIMLTEDWPCLEHVRTYYRERSRSRAAVDEIAPEIMRVLQKKGSASSQELGIAGRADWYWSETSLSRAALETLYFRGDLVVHHKKGTVKSYAPADVCLPEALLRAACPFKSGQERQTWQALRRIGAVGLLWNAPSDAWLGIDGMKASERGRAFETLLDRGEILPVEVEGIEKPLYVKTGDLTMLSGCEGPFSGAKRVRLLPPLDCMLWDRKLIAALFGFRYKWEIYTPLEQRKYGYYVLPVLYGERFAGRIEPVCERKRGVLSLRRFWPETGFRATEAFVEALEKEMERLRAFHGLERVEWENGWMQG